MNLCRSGIKQEYIDDVARQFEELITFLEPIMDSPLDAAGNILLKRKQKTLFPLLQDHVHHALSGEDGDPHPLKRSKTTSLNRDTELLPPDMAENISALPMMPNMSGPSGRLFMAGIMT